MNVVEGIRNVRTSELADWNAIDWRSADKATRRLQARIVKAQGEGRYGKVRALQRLLTRSFSGQAMAVKRVTENHGRKTAGVDGVLWDSPEKKAKAVRDLHPEGYRAKPLRRVYIPKASGKMRPLGIPTMDDRAMQALYLQALDPVAECKGDNVSYGFRRKRSAADAMEQVFASLSKGHSPQWVLEGDIKGCFDHISHDWMLASIPMEKRILHQWLKAGYMEKDVFCDTTAGTPQGGIISPVLANMVLDGLEELLNRRYKIRRRYKGEMCWFPPKKAQNRRVNLVRYADDFVITGDSKELLEDEIKPLVRDFLAARGLSLSEEKTRITHIDEGFDFLGFNVRKFDGKLLIQPSARSVSHLLDSVRETVRKHKTAAAYRLIGALNPVIRGWANYYRHVASKQTFSKIDHHIWCAIWRWAKRRHSGKSKGWIKHKYFIRKDNRDWVFFGDTPEGTRLTLFSLAAIKIERHVKVKNGANPYDPSWQPYFDQRDRGHVRGSLMHTNVVKRLWQRQEGCCPVCGQPLGSHSEWGVFRIDWNTHHIEPKAKGGSDDIANLALCHAACHRQHHARQGADSQSCTGCRTRDALQKLEPYEGKLSRTVLRGEGAGNRSDLPDSDDAGFAAIKDAYFNNEPIALAILDGVGGEGLDADFSITNFSRKEALEEAITVSVTAKPTYSTRAPAWVEPTP
jgi:RNA-directed DNA polymerase